MLATLAVLAENPHAGKKLKGEYKDFYSIRAWPYRVIYYIHKKEVLIIVVRISHRQGAY